MATDSTAWDITVPANSDNLSAGAEDMREFKEQVEARLNKEHVDFGASTAGGEHVAGSAMAYYQSAVPTTDPAGNALDTSSTTDDGRIFWDSDDNRLYVWNGTDFTTELAYLQSVATVSSGDALDITNSGTGNAIDVHLSGAGTGVNIATTHVSAAPIVITTVATSTVAGAIQITTGSTNAETNGINITMGTSSSNAAHFNLAGDPGNVSPADGDVWYNGTNIKLNDGTTTRHLSMSDGTTGGASSAGSGNQYVELKIGSLTYKVLHDGTV